MTKLIPGNHKHLTLEDRQIIETLLAEGQSFKYIAKVICKDPTTISKEVKLHRHMNTWNTRSFNNPLNFCNHRYHCRKTNACDKLHPCEINCRSCSKCNQVCPRFEKERCTRLDHAPYVCNGCDKKRHLCTVPHKYEYNAAFADRKYRETLSSSREGINKTPAQIREMNQIINPLIHQGQSPYVILTNYPELDVSTKTLYNYIDQGILTQRNVDLKRKVKYKPRKQKKKRITSREIFVGRIYQDFLALELTADQFVEMDTVISAQGSEKCILTFFFPDTHLFLAFLLNRCTTGAVRAVFDRLERSFTTFDFHALFPVILTDRGSEFGDPVRLETGYDDVQRTSIYYCDPMCSGQKGGLEQAHTLLRMVLAKKTVFDYLTQWQLRTIVNHINSYPRESLKGATPYQKALEKHGEDTLRKLQLRPVPPDDVTLTPKLIKK